MSLKYFNRYNNYLHSSSVFIAESGQPVESPFDRNFIARELNILEDNSSKKVPLLYSLLFGLKKEIYEPNQFNSNNINNYTQNDNKSNNILLSNSSMPKYDNNQINSSKSPIMTTSVNKLKDQSVNFNNSLRNNINNNNNGNNSGNYISTKDQPKPWIIDQ